MNEITIQLGDWLFNAGVVGLVNILLHAGDEVKLNGQEVSFNAGVLDKFEEKYFKYFIDTYEKTLAWYKVVSFEDFIKKHEEENFESFTEKDLEILNQYIGSGSKSGTLKYILTSNSHKAAYNLITSELDVLELEKQISTIKLKKNEELKDQIPKIKDLMKKIHDIIRYYNQPDAKKYIAAKNVIYTIINNAWNNVSFLNRQTKIPDMYEDYKIYFLQGLNDYLNNNKKEYNYSCSNCGSLMNDMNNDIAFLNATGFDTSRKLSNVWNFNNDIAICPVCKIVYSCVPAGFTYVYDKGIFINQNQDIQSAVNVNQRIKSEIIDSGDVKNIWEFYRIVSEEMERKINEGVKYELVDIQVVRYENESYRFNLLSKKMLKVLSKSTKELNALLKLGYKEVNTYFNIYDEVMKRLLNNENLFLLIHKLMIQKLTKPSESYYQMRNINYLLEINNNYLEGVVGMEVKERDILELSKNAGYYFRKAYEERNVENKINGIAYRLLNALKTNNQHMFMDTLINCYLYIKQSVPKVFIDGMKDDYEFKSVGYAFVAGMTSESKKNEENN